MTSTVSGGYCAEFKGEQTGGAAVDCTDQALPSGGGPSHREARQSGEKSYYRHRLWRWRGAEGQPGSHTGLGSIEAESRVDSGIDMG